MKGRPWPLSKQHSPSKAFKMGTQGLAFFNITKDKELVSTRRPAVSDRATGHDNGTTRRPVDPSTRNTGANLKAYKRSSGSNC